MLYADTADLEQLEEMLSLGIFSAVTTNPKIMAKARPENYEDRIRDICKMSPGSVSVELRHGNEDYDVLVEEARLLHMIDKTKIVIKVPMWDDGTGVALCKQLTDEGIRVNMTCLMSASQVMLGCLAKATYVSLFYNRMIDYYGRKGTTSENLVIGRDAANLQIECSRNMIDRFGWSSKIICGSIRSQEDVALCLLRGSDIVTVPYDRYRELFKHTKTNEAIKEFEDSWRKYQDEQR